MCVNKDHSNIIITTARVQDLVGRPLSSHFPSLLSTFFSSLQLPTNVTLCLQPEFKTSWVGRDDRYLLLFTDGISEFLIDEEIVQTVHQAASQGLPPQVRDDRRKSLIMFFFKLYLTGVMLVAHEFRR
jgi:serine/threonine protein phosphatase PrpC